MSSRNAAPAVAFKVSADQKKEIDAYAERVYNRRLQGEITPADYAAELVQIGKARSGQIDPNEFLTAPDPLQAAQPTIYKAGAELQNNGIDPFDPTARSEYKAALQKHIASHGELEPSILHEVNAEWLDRYSGLQGQVDVSGGFLLPADTRAEIRSREPAISEVIGLATPVQATSDQVVWPRVQPNPNSPSIYTSAFVGSMVGEIPAASAGQNEPSFGTFGISLKRARALALVSMDLAQDVENLFEFLIRDGSRNLALLKESQMIAGSGIGPNVKGALEYAGSGADDIATVDVEGTTSNTISNTTSGLGSAPKIMNLVYGVPAQYRRAPGFRVVMRSSTELAIRKLVDANARPIWGESFFSRPDNLLGYKPATSEFMEADGSDGRRVLLAGDFSELILATRSDIRVQVADQRYADTDQIGLFIRQRFGVGVANVDAFRIGVV